MDYFVDFNETSLWEHSYNDAKKIAEDASAKYGKAIIICQEMQHFKKGLRKVATRIWVESYTNGVCETRTPTNTRLSVKQNKEIPIQEWEDEMLEILKYYYPNKQFKD